MNIGMQVKYGLEKVWRSELSNNAKMLYVELFIECNNNFWEEIETSSKELQERLNFTEVQLRRARNELIEEGYITYNKGTNKSKKAIYDIVEKIKNDDVIDGCFVERNVVEFDEDKKELETQETQENLLRQKGEFDEVNYCVVDDVIDEVTDEVAPQKASNNKRLRTL
jgi:hypothetical protein